MKWFPLRCLMLVGIFVGMLFIPPDRYDVIVRLPIPVLVAVIIVVAATVAVMPWLVVLSIHFHRSRGMRPPPWNPPSNQANPCEVVNPLVLVHLVSQMLIVGGTSLLIAALWIGWPALLHGVLSIWAGFTTLVGLRMYMRKYPEDVKPSACETAFVETTEL